jgi:hypothetical protein
MKNKPLVVSTFRSLSVASQAEIIRYFYFVKPAGNPNDFSVKNEWLSKTHFYSTAVLLGFGQVHRRWQKSVK